MHNNGLILDFFLSDAKAASRFADLRIVDIVDGADVRRHPGQEQLQLGQPSAVLRRRAGEETQRDHEPGRRRSLSSQLAIIIRIKARIALIF